MVPILKKVRCLYIEVLCLGQRDHHNIDLKAWIKDQKQQRNIKEAELPPHLKRHFDKDGNVKKGSWKSGDWKADKKQPKVKFTVKDVTPKGYAPTEDINKMDMGDVIKDFYKKK